MPRQRRSKAQQRRINEAIGAAVPVILKSIGRRLTERHPKQWVPVTDLIQLDRDVSQNVWKGGYDVRITGTKCHSSFEGNHLLRHKFDWRWIVLGRPALRNIEEPRTEEARRNRYTPLPRPVDTSTLDDFDETKNLVEQDIRSVIDAINAAKTATDPADEETTSASAASASATAARRKRNNDDVDEAPIVVQESTGTSLAVVEPSSVAAEKVIHRVQPSYRKRRARIKATTERKRKREDDLPERKRKKILQDRKVKTKEVVVKPMEEAATYPLAEGYTRSFGSLMMGHGLKNFRDSNEVDSVAAGILEEQFQCGVAKESNRKGVLEMEEECARQMPSLLVPPRTTIAAWLQTRLNNAKNTKEKQGDSNEKRKYTQDESKQQKAAVVSKKEKEKLGTDDKRSRDLWLSKYKGILLEYSSDGGDGSDVIEEEIRIVASVRFNNNTKRWEAETDHASEIEDLQRAVSSAVPAGTDDIIYIPIGSLKSKGEIGPFIKAYNERLFATDGD